MRITKKALGKYTLTKKSWDEIGQKTGWLNEEKNDMLGSSLDEYENFEQPPHPLPGKILTTYSLEEILMAMRYLGEVNIAGFGNIEKRDVKSILGSADPDKLQKIWNYLVKISPSSPSSSFAFVNGKITKRAMSLDGQIQSYIKKVKTKAGKEFYALVLYGNTRPISGYLGKPNKKSKKGQEKLFFNYFQGTWSRIIPESFITKITTGVSIEDPKAAGFLKAIDALTRGFDIDGTTIKADLGPLYDASSYDDKVQVSQQTEISGLQKEIKDATMRAGTSPQKLEALSLFIEAEIKRVSEMTDVAKQSVFIKSYLAFVSRFYEYSFRNQILIWIQKPTATKVAGVYDWRNKFGREVIDWGDPITIIAPLTMKRKDSNLQSDIQKWKQEGMSDDEISKKSHYTAFGSVSVFDISATQVIAGWTDKNGNPPPEEANWRQDSNDSIEEVTTLVDAGIKWAENNNINVSLKKLDDSLGGSSSGGDIIINDKYDGINKFSTLVHESAHEILHWEHDKGKNVRNMMGETEGRMVKEIDAETTAFIVLQHYGFDTVDTPNYLALWSATGVDIVARKSNITDSVKIIIKGIDSEVKKIEMSDDQIDQLTKEDTIDSINNTKDTIDMKKDIIEQPEESEQLEQSENFEQPLVKVEETSDLETNNTTASNEDPFLKVAMKFKSNKIMNIQSNFFGNLGLNLD